MKRNRNTLIILFFVFNFTVVFGQLTVVGKLLDSEKNPIEMANIVLLNKNNQILKGTTTNSLGIFKLEYEKSGSYKLKISYIGFNDIVKQVNGSVDLGSITLSKNSLDEVVITAKPRIRLKKKGGKYIVAVKNTTFTNSDNVFEGLKQVPLLNISDNALKVNNKNAIIEINGIKTQMTGADLQDYLKSLDPNTIKNIEINSNPNSSYGTEVDAVINIITSYKINNYRVSIKTKNGYHSNYFNNDNINLSLNLKKISIYANYSFDDTPKINTSSVTQNVNNITSNFDFKENEKVRSHNILLNLGFHLNSKNSIDLTQILSIKNSNIVSKPTNTIQGRTTFLDAKNKTTQLSQVWKRNINDSTSTKLGFYEVFKNFRTYNRGVEINQPEIVQKIETKIPLLIGFFDYSHTNKLGEIALGAKYNNIAVSNDNFTVQNNQNINSPYNYNEKILAFYVNQTFNLPKEETVDIGIRTETSFIDYTFANSLINETLSNKTEYTNLLYNVSYNWVSSNKWNKSLAFRKQITRPNYDYLNPFKTVSSNVTMFAGNLNINPTKHYSLSYEFGKKKVYLYTQLGLMKDFISTITTLNNGTLVQTYRNFDKLFYGAIGGQYFTSFLNRKWRTKNGVNINYVLLKDASFDEIGSATPILSFHSNNSIKLAKKTYFNFNYEMEPSYFDGLVKHFTTHRLDIYISKHINKFNLSIFGKDIFKTNRTFEKTTFTNFSYSSDDYYDERSFGISLRYSISGKTYKRRKIEKPTDNSIDRLDD